MNERLPTWVTLSLAEPLDEATLLERAAALGVNISPTRDGLQLPGGFLARLDASPFPARLVDGSLAQEPLQMGPACLHISGGTNEIERGQHQQPAALRATAREAANRFAAMSGRETTGERVLSAASQKVTRLTKLVRSLCPLASAIVLPRANHLAVNARAYEERGDSGVDGASALPLWTHFKVRPDAAAQHVVSEGMWVYGLPDVAAPLTEGADPRAVSRSLGAVQWEMVSEGWWPEDGEIFDTEQGPLRLVRILDMIWVQPADQPETARLLAACANMARARVPRLVLGGVATQHRRPAEPGKIAVEHFLFGDRESMAISNGLSAIPQPGGVHERGNVHIELAVVSPELGPWASFWLDWGAASIALHGPDRPIHAWERLVIDSPVDGIVGVIFWPMGHLAPFGPSGTQVALWDMLPITGAELDSFRREPGAQSAWLDARETNRDIHHIHARWRAGGG